MNETNKFKDVPCKMCQKPSKLWSQKKNEEVQHWCSHMCKLKFYGEDKMQMDEKRQSGAV